MTRHGLYACVARSLRRSARFPHSTNTTTAATTTTTTTTTAAAAAAAAAAADTPQIRQAHTSTDTQTPDTHNHANTVVVGVPLLARELAPPAVRGGLCSGECSLMEERGDCS
jgi:hypothetical protein